MSKKLPRYLNTPSISHSNVPASPRYLVVAINIIMSDQSINVAKSPKLVVFDLE